MSTYKQAGVDIDAQDKALSRIGRHVESTRTPETLSGLGAFGGLFRADFSGLNEPVLVASADGVGTKLDVARMVGRHDSIGADLVHHLIDDILVQGARPLFFLDYFATSKLEPEQLEQVVGGMAGACKDHGIAILGGETAEMAGYYPDGRYDLAGFIVGVVDRSKILGPERVRVGQVLVGLPSTGLHTNGFTLARHVLFEVMGLEAGDRCPGHGRRSVGDVLLEVHRAYLHSLMPLLDEGLVAAAAHITGGGLPDNLPRVLPKTVDAVIKLGAWAVPPIFSLLAREGEIPEGDLLRTFNCGVGMVLAVEADDLEAVLESLKGSGCQGFPMGNLVEGRGEVHFDHPPEGAHPWLE